MTPPKWASRLIFVCLAVTSGLCLASDGPPAWNTKRFSEDTEAILAAASQVHAAAGSDVVVLYEEENCQFEADGRAIQTSYLVYKVLTQQGADQWGEISHEWEPWHQEQPTLRARVITPDHVIHPLDPKTITDSPAKEDQEETFSDRRVVRAPLPAMAPGSIVEEEHLAKDTAPMFGAGTVSFFNFGRGVPVQQTRLVLESPSSLTLRYSVQMLPDMKPVRTEENGRVRLTFDSGPVEALDKVENDLPSDVHQYPRVWFSTGSSWQHMAQEYSKLIDAQLAKDDLKVLVSRLVAGKSSREDKATAILQYLDREVRYTGIEFGDAAITPHPLSETLNHKFGDCKDKAVLLVAMLRTAGILSYPVLLNVGRREDVPSELPGMGMFDHMIVYAPGSPDFWIDATDQYARLGQIPAGDQGRLALVVRPESDSLIRTPFSMSRENLLIEKREFYLAENGPARVVETSQPIGSLESQYRAAYTDKDNKDRRKGLADYMHTQYLADKLDRMDRTDPADISKQFELVLETNKANRGFTDLETAIAAIRYDTLFSRLPTELQERDKEEDKKPDSPEEKPKKPRTADYQLFSAFITEWDYKIIPPFGFQPKPLPKDVKLSLGPALLTEDFSKDNDGVVHAVIRFDTVKGRLSISEATEMRNQIAQLRSGAPIQILFEPVGRTLLNEGKIHESMAAFRASIAAHPKEAVHHLQIARALLDVGLGESARAEAQQAVKLEPNSSLAQQTLADILEYDLVGRKFRPGSDYAGAEAAYRAAQKLDPDDKAVTGNLAILLEFNHEGERYGPGAKLKEALAEYAKLKPQELAGYGLQNNVAFSLAYVGDFPAARKEAESLNPPPLAVIAAAEAATNGSAAGIAEARKRAGNEATLNQVLYNAATILMRRQKYSEAADLLEASASGDNASSTVAFASYLRKARPHQEIHIKSDPGGVVLQSYINMAEGKMNLEKLRDQASRNQRLVISLSDPEELKQAIEAGAQIRNRLARTGVPADVMIDMMIQVIEPVVEGTDASGYRVTLRIPNANASKFFVVKEGDQYKVLAMALKANAIGFEILDRLAANDHDGARVLLDWLREEQHLAGGDDPFIGFAFPRFWTRGKDADAAQMKLAAAAILVQSKETAPQGIAILEAARADAKTDSEKLNLLFGLRNGYLNLNLYEKLWEVSSELARQDPESKTLFSNQEFALRGLGRTSEGDQLAQERLKRSADDLDALRALSWNADARGDYALAREIRLRTVATGKAESSDLNGAAWTSLFTGEVKQADIETALKSAQLNQNNSSVLHTLGSLYAEVGKIKEAREVLVQAMDQLSLDEPDSNYWYAFGRIAEQCGETEVARSDYQRVKKPLQPGEIPTSTYLLAQNRLKTVDGALAAGKPAQPAQQGKKK